MPGAMIVGQLIFIVLCLAVVPGVVLGKTEPITIKKHYNRLLVLIVDVLGKEGLKINKLTVLYTLNNSCRSRWKQGRRRLLLDAWDV